MHLGKLNETVILIDTDFLNERIEDNLNFYKNLYPNRTFNKINLANLLYKFALSARVEEPGQTIDILFAYTLDKSILTHCEPNDVFDFIDTHQVTMETNIGTFRIRSFFADESSSCIEHFIDMFLDVYSDPQVSRIILVADNEELHNLIKEERMLEESTKRFFLLKKSHDSKISLPIYYVDIDNIIGFSLGLSIHEI